MTDLYSTREGLGPRRDREAISLGAWQGIAALIGQWANNGSLARHFPLYECADDPGRNTITGTDMGMFLHAITGHIPDLAVTLQPDGLELKRSPLDPYSMPDTASVLDLVEFVARYIDKPIDATNHQRGSNHTHYTFRHGDDTDQFSDRRLSPGEAELRDKVNEIFERNGIAYIVSDTMEVQRLGPVEARRLVSEFRPSTGDARLDGLFDDAMGRFLSRNPADRQDAVEKLWDAFERLKTLEGNKVVGAPKLIKDAALDSEPFRELLTEEFILLTRVGNNFTIRHHELDKTPPPSDDVRDYLFVRLASVIAVVLRHTGRFA